MSLLRLLTTGKSLVGLKKLEHRYRLPNEGALPRFGSKKNPFRATVFPEKPEASEGASQGEACQVGQLLPNMEAPVAPPLKSPALEKAQNQAPEYATQPKQVVVETTRPAPEAPVKRPSGLKAFLLWGRVKKSKLASVATGRPLVQTELSLDSVKVVRNDLSETDLEVVAVKPATKPTSKRTEPEPGLGVPEASGERAAGQLVEAGKM